MDVEDLDAVSPGEACERSERKRQRSEESERRLEALAVQTAQPHPDVGVAGALLDDGARGPWLDRLDAILRHHATTGVVLACSALKHTYRERLTGGVAEVVFVALVAPRDVLRERIADRRGHFAGTDLLDSQLATLELGDDVNIVDATKPLEDVVSAARSAVG